MTCPPLDVGQTCPECGGTEEPRSTYTHPETGVVWLRSGHCCQCGQCCAGDPFEGALGVNIIDGTRVCGLLRKQPNGQFRCSDRQAYLYLNGCNVWPQFPAHLAGYDKCSYRFEQVLPA